MYFVDYTKRVRGGLLSLTPRKGEKETVCNNCRPATSGRQLKNISSGKIMDGKSLFGGQLLLFSRLSKLPILKTGGSEVDFSKGCGEI